MKPDTRPVGQLVNKIGQYLFKNIESAYKGVRSSNTYDVYMFVYYQLPVLQQIPGREKEGYNDMHEMHINISITTYQNKIRINLTEISPEEWTFGQIILPPEKLQDMPTVRNQVYNKIIMLLRKHYEGYNFLF